MDGSFPRLRFFIRYYNQELTERFFFHRLHQKFRYETTIPNVIDVLVRFAGLSLVHLV